MAAERGRAVSAEEIGDVRCDRPQTGSEYLESLRDGREVYIYGERVADVTTHPAFRNTARMTARLFDALHDPEHRARSCRRPTPTGTAGRTPSSKRRRPWKNRSRDAMRSRSGSGITYGWMGRSPDYKAAFLGTLGGNAEFYEPFQANAKRWYTFCQERVPFVNHAIIHPPVDRDKPPDQVADVCVHVDKETDGGIFVSGAKVVATGSVLTNYTFIAHHGLIPLQDKKFALVLMVPTNAPGREVPVPHVVRDDRHGDVEPLRPAAVVAAGRERRGVHHGPRLRPVGERLRVRRRGQGEQLLPANRIPAALRRARLHQSIPLVSGRAALGAFGGLIMGMLILNPLFGAVAGSAIGATSGLLGDAGIDDAFMKTPRRNTGARQSRRSSSSCGKPSRSKCSSGSNPLLDVARFCSAPCPPRTRSLLRNLLEGELSRLQTTATTPQSKP